MRNSSFYNKIPSDCVLPTLSDDDTDINYDEFVLNPAPSPQLNQGAVQVDPHVVDPTVLVPQVNPLGPVMDRPVHNRRPPGHLKDCIMKSKYAPLKDLNNT